MSNCNNRINYAPRALYSFSRMKVTVCEKTEGDKQREIAVCSSLSINIKISAHKHGCLITHSTRVNNNQFNQSHILVALRNMHFS